MLLEHTKSEEFAKKIFNLKDFSGSVKRLCLDEVTKVIDADEARMSDDLPELSYKPTMISFPPRL